MTPLRIYIWYLASNCLTITWVILFEKEILLPAFLCLALQCYTLSIALAMSLVSVKKTLEIKQDPAVSKEIYRVRFLAQNAMGLYLSWMTFIALLNLAFVLVSQGGSQETETTIALGVIIGKVALWFVLDTFVLFRYSNYLVSPYFVPPLVALGIILNNFALWHRNSIMKLFLLLFSSSVLIAKLLITSHRNDLGSGSGSRSRRVLPDNSMKEEKVESENNIEADSKSDERDEY